MRTTEPRPSVWRHVGNVVADEFEWSDIRLMRFENDVHRAAAGVEEVGAEVRRLNTDVDALRTDIGGLRIDVVGLRTDLSDLKARLSGLEQALERDVRAPGSIGRDEVPGS